MGRPRKLVSTYKDTLGKRDVVRNMLEEKHLVSDICKAIGATRDELEFNYGDLVAKYNPIEYIPSKEDRLLVWRSVAYGMTQAQIASRLGISVMMLQNHYRRELDQAYMEWTDAVATTLVTQAKNGSVPAGIFLLKARAGWKETSVNELSGPGGAPIQTEDVTVGAKQILMQKILKLTGKEE